MFPAPAPISTPLSPLLLTRSHSLSSLAHVQNCRTPLHRAAENGHTATAALLIEKGADVNAKGRVSGDCVAA